MYIVKKFEIVFPLMSKIIIYFHVYIILNFPIIYRNASVLCQSECACLHTTVNMVGFVWLKEMKTLIQMYRVVPIMKRENKKDMETTYLPSSSPRPSSYTRTPPSSSSLLSTYFPIAL